MPICCQAAACADTTTNAAHPRGARPMRLKPRTRDEGALAVVAVMARRAPRFVPGKMPYRPPARIRRPWMA